MRSVLSLEQNIDKSSLSMLQSMVIKDKHTMLFILFLILTQIEQTVLLERTRPVSIVLDGFTFESWNQQSVWNQTRAMIVRHLNALCKHDRHCDADYGINNIHLLDLWQSGISSIALSISVDEPILTRTTIPYNYTALLTSAIYQAKIDIENMYDNQLFSTTMFSVSSSDPTPVFNRTHRLLFVLLGIGIVTLVFALTIFFFQRIHQHSYSRLMKTTRTYQQKPDELLNHSPSISPANP